MFCVKTLCLEYHFGGGGIFTLDILWRHVITVNVSELTIAASVGVVDEEGNIFSGVCRHVHVQLHTSA